METGLRANRLVVPADVGGLTIRVRFTCGGDAMANGVIAEAELTCATLAVVETAIPTGRRDRWQVEHAKAMRLGGTVAIN